jgi:hypothetical protein
LQSATDIGWRAVKFALAKWTIRGAVAGPISAPAFRQIGRDGKRVKWKTEAAGREVRNTRSAGDLAAGALVVPQLTWRPE